MTTKGKEQVLVVLQLTGGNDYMNTVIPYADSRYRDYRPKVGINDEQTMPLDGKVALHLSMAPLKSLWDQKKMAIVHGVGYSNPSARTSAPWTSGILRSLTRWGWRGGPG